MTYNDLPSGVFSSQVIDVVNFLNSEYKADVKLVSFISLRGFFKNRTSIKKQLPSSIILPMFPGIQRWRKNRFLLVLLILLLKPKIIIGRSVIATKLALNANKNKFIKIVYDGRGAISAEWHEYNVVNSSHLLNEIEAIERDVIHSADYRIAVSSELVKHWQNHFGYSLNNYVIIPCTLNKKFQEVNLTIELIKDKRAQLKLLDDDIVFVYSGSVAGWQSFDLLANFLTHVLKQNSKCKIVFFSDFSKSVEDLINVFPQQVFCQHLASNEVSDYLIVGDYGLLIREETVTNKVASPVKFAEYLACGLKVIVSDHLGDYSALLKEHKELGFLMNEFNLNYSEINLDAKLKIVKMAKSKFLKSNYKNEYQKIIDLLKT